MCTKGTLPSKKRGEVPDHPFTEKYFDPHPPLLGKEGILPPFFCINSSTASRGITSESIFQADQRVGVGSPHVH